MPQCDTVSGACEESSGKSRFISSELSVPFSGEDWFDPLEEAVRFHVRGFIEGVVEEDQSVIRNLAFRPGRDPVKSLAVALSL